MRVFLSSVITSAKSQIQTPGHETSGPGWTHPGRRQAHFLCLRCKEQSHDSVPVLYTLALLTRTLSFTNRVSSLHTPVNMDIPPVLEGDAALLRDFVTVAVRDVVGVAETASTVKHTRSLLKTRGDGDWFPQDMCALQTSRTTSRLPNILV
jgi:hypothetical protein